MKTSKRQIFSRKDEHIKYVMNNKVESKSTLFECVHLIHTALPEMNLDEVNLSTRFLEKDISCPIIISPLTGGTIQGAKINEKLASTANKHNIPMMIGSQRIILEHPETIDSFRITRLRAPEIPIIANIGIPQLKTKENLENLDKIIKVIDADALAIHLNPLQEAIQPEGEPHFLNGMEKISDILSDLKIPVIVRETGCGISKEVAKELIDLGIKFIDISGVGGTSWSAVEHYRSKSKNNHIKTGLGKAFWNWGIPTAASIMEVKSATSPDENVKIIASGGIRNGLDIAKSLILGADYAGLAKPFLSTSKKLYQNPDHLLTNLKEELKVCMFLTGSRSIEEFKQKPKVIFPPLRDWMEQRIH